MYSSERMRRNEILLTFIHHYFERPAKTVIGLLLRRQQLLNSAWEIDTTPGQADDIGKYWYRLQNGIKQFKYSLMF